MRGGRLPLCPPPRVHRAGRHRSVWLSLAPPDQRLQSFARVTEEGSLQTRGLQPTRGRGSGRQGPGAGTRPCPLPPGPSPHRSHRHVPTLSAGSSGAKPISLCGANTTFPFRDTGTLTCNDAVFLQGLLPADLERSVQNLCETQMPHSSWSWQLKTVTVNATAPSLSVRSRRGGGGEF